MGARWIVDGAVCAEGIVSSVQWRIDILLTSRILDVVIE